MSDDQGRLPRIVAFGDSLTAGFGVAPHQAYPFLLQARLQDAGYQYTVVNAGVSGETTAGGVRRVDWILKSQPSVVILELGANDGLRGQDLQEMASNLRHIVERFQAAKVRILFVGMKIPPNYGQDYTMQFSETYPQIAKELDVPLMPFFLEGVAAETELTQGDGIHPNAKGYKLIVENLLPFITPLLDCASPRCQ
ncbi:MAG: arylesterase [Nitrospirales bacterium]|nr:arylesterase [Nitrospirales bacterium]